MNSTKKKSKKPVFVSPFTDKSEYVEKTSSKPVATFIPHQAITLNELVSRFERGQRLNVHQNFRPLDNFTNDSIYEESFDDAPPPDVHDITDVHEYYKEHQEHVKDYKQRKGKSKQAQPASAPQAKQDPASAPASAAE